MPPHTTEARVELDAARAAFKARVASQGMKPAWAAFKGRIAAVLAGGGARGAYEAGALLAFQDAGLPTHIITATSIGGINGASYAAYAEGYVGNAEPLVSAWFDLAPPTVGVEWTRYVWMLGGAAAMFSGLTNLTYYLMQTRGTQIHLQHPALAWISLFMAGLSVLFFYDRLPYVYFAIQQRIRRGARWRPAPRRLGISIFANLLVLAFLVIIVWSTRLETTFRELLGNQPLLVAAGLAVLFVLQRLRRRYHFGFGRLWGRLLRIPFGTGIFSNFERTRYLSPRIPAEGLRQTPIRVVLAATDLENGTPRYFTNADPASLLGDPGVDPRFVQQELVRTDDLMPAVIASSAIPIVYQPMELDGRLHADGAIVMGQPVRLAIRMGADVLFVVSMESSGAEREPMRTFVDVGLRALDILMQGNVQRDVALLAQANRQIEDAANALGLRAEDVVIEFEGRRFRYVKAYPVKPTAPIRHTALDFGGRATGDTIVQGYKDAVAQLEAFAAYAATEGFRPERRVLPLQIIESE